MAGIDRKLLQKEARKRVRQQAADSRKQKDLSKRTTQSPEVLNDSSSSTSENTDDDQDFAIPSSSHYAQITPKQKRLNVISNQDVASALDRVNLPDRGAMFVVASVAKALGHPVKDLALSRSTIRRSRMSTRKHVCQTDKEAFTTQCPLILHWDGKLLPDIAGSKETVDRIVVVVTGDGVEKLLAVPKIGKGTGQEQAGACLKILNDWKLVDNIQGMMFDTTASNTGIRQGACVLIEEALGRELVNIGCRHHVVEVVLSSIFIVLFGATGGPAVGLFKRFQSKWPYIQQTDYTPADDKFFDGEMEILRQEMVAYYNDAISHQQPREDYLELLQLCLVFLKKDPLRTSSKFKAPGAMHHARWMMKAIYALKMVLFADQLTLTKREKSGLTELALFVSLIYARFWHEAPLASRAPRNDAQMLSLLQKYPNRVIGDAAFMAFSRHLWFFSEHLVGLAFFDSRVDSDTKRAMAANLKLPKTQSALKRADACTSNFNRLESFVTERTNHLFKLLSNTGDEKARNFLLKDPDEWHADASYQNLSESVHRMKVVNDIAERSIALIEKYNESLTKDEDQKQFLLRLVQHHRQMYPTSSKSVML
jgi:hypothetical protein